MWYNSYYCQFNEIVKTMADNISDRRPLKIRSMLIFQKTAKYLGDKNITPNQISVASVFFAALTAICLVFFPYVESSFNWVLLLLAIFFIKMRAACNILDGVLAIECGKTTPSGKMFNDIPDRIADPLVLVAAGYAIFDLFSLAYMLGWLAGIMAVMTAYIRVLSASLGAPSDFSGPMSKVHRVTLLTIACFLTIFEGIFWQQGYIMAFTLIIITIGCFITCYRRALSGYRYLESNK